MGIGGIESSVSSSTVRSMNTKTVTPVTPEVNSISGSPMADNYAKVVQPSEQQTAGEQTGEQGKEQFYSDERPIQEVSKDKVESALRDINTKIRPTHTECQFTYHEETKRISIKVMDQATGEVIREIPPEKTLDMIAKTLELAGILVDEKR